MSKALKITLSVVSILLTLIICVIGVYFFWPWHKDFFNNADAEFDIPGLDTEFCPQGMTELKGYNKYLISGYMDDGSPSRFYVIDSETKKIDKYFTLNINGKKYNGHAGGVTSYNSTIWTVSQEEGEGYALRFMATDIVNVADGGEVVVRDYFKTLNNADFAFVRDKYLWVGEFYKPEKYETDENHHVQIRRGETNRAICYAYKIDESDKFGLDDDFPVKALSVRDLCQGIDVTEDGKFVMSTSFSLSDSHIYYYKDVLAEEQDSTIRVGLQDVPLWYLDNSALIGEAQIPAMSEELFVKNNRVYLLFESACKKYKMFNRVRIKQVYSFELAYLEK